MLLFVPTFAVVYGWGIWHERQLHLDKQKLGRTQSASPKTEVWVDIEATNNQGNELQAPEELSHHQLRLLEHLEEEAGLRLNVKMPLATAFDSLRLTALVGSLRRSEAPHLTLRDALACDTVFDLLKLASSKKGLKLEDAKPCEAPDHFKVREWPYMFSLSVCWALETQTPCGTEEIEAMKVALQRLVARHGALSMRLADPPAMWDLAMEAAANLSLARATLRNVEGVESGKGARRRQRRRIGNIMDFIGWLLWTAWPQLQHERNCEVHFDVVDCESSKQLEWRSAWLLDGRNGRQVLENPIHAVLLKDSRKSRLHLAVSHGLADGFSGLPLLQDFIRFYHEAVQSKDHREEPFHHRFSGLSSQEARLKGALLVSEETIEVADISSWALQSSTYEAWHWRWQTYTFGCGGSITFSES